MIEAFAQRFPCRIIGHSIDTLGPLIRRYFLLRTKWLGVYLHHLCRSDEDRALHDHPWTFISIILAGGYTEHTPKGSKHYYAGSILFRPAEWQHRLELSKPAWSLVIRFRRVREWGFWCPLGWIPWTQFDKQGGCE